MFDIRTELHDLLPPAASTRTYLLPPAAAARAYLLPPAAARACEVGEGEGVERPPARSPATGVVVEAARLGFQSCRICNLQWSSTLEEKTVGEINQRWCGDGRRGG